MPNITREQLVEEFGSPGVDNPALLDLITFDSTSNRVVLVMVESRPWGGDLHQLGQIEEKINRYLGYVLDGYLVEQYPQYRDKRVLVRLECAEAPVGEAVRFLDAARASIEAQGVDFAVHVALQGSWSVRGVT